ncbi:unnamed protein product [Closterium sp. NIES-53]
MFYTQLRCFAALAQGWSSRASRCRPSTAAYNNTAAHITSSQCQLHPASFLSSPYEFVGFYGRGHSSSNKTRFRNGSVIDHFSSFARSSAQFPEFDSSASTLARGMSQHASTPAEGAADAAPGAAQSEVVAFDAPKSIPGMMEVRQLLTDDPAGGWDKAWQASTTPWDLGGVTPAVAALVAAHQGSPLHLPPSIRCVLVPGSREGGSESKACVMIAAWLSKTSHALGTSLHAIMWVHGMAWQGYDVEALASDGREATGLDISPAAVVHAEKVSVRGMQRREGGRAWHGCGTNARPSRCLMSTTRTSRWTVPVQPALHPFALPFFAHPFAHTPALPLFSTPPLLPNFYPFNPLYPLNLPTLSFSRSSSSRSLLTPAIGGGDKQGGHGVLVWRLFSPQPTTALPRHL